MTEAAKIAAIAFYKACEELHDFSETIIFDADVFLKSDFTEFWEDGKDFVIKAIDSIRSKDENASFFIEMYGCDGERGQIDLIYADTIIIKTILSPSEIYAEFENAGEDTFPSDEVYEFTADKSYHFINDDGSLSDFSEKYRLSPGQHMLGVGWD